MNLFIVIILFLFVRVYCCGEFFVVISYWFFFIPNPYNTFSSIFIFHFKESLKCQEETYIYIHRMIYIDIGKGGKNYIHVQLSPFERFLFATHGTRKIILKKKTSPIKSCLLKSQRGSVVVSSLLFSFFESRVIIIIF